MMRKINYKSSFLYLLNLVILLLIINPQNILSQVTPADTTQQIKFPDEFTELDDNINNDIFRSKDYVNSVKMARGKYHDALVYLRKRDSVRAAKSFEAAINIVNPYVSYPGIENEKEFLDLVHSIIEDYENYITTIDDLDENSSIFIVRKMLFNQIETLKTETITPLTNTHVASAGENTAGKKSTIGFFPPPDTLTIPIEMNEQVEKAIEKLTTNKTLKKYFKVYLERSTRYFPMMEKIANFENAPLELIYLTMYESGVNPNAISSASAVGLWQFIHSTGEMYNLNKNHSIWVDERRDPEKSSRAAIRHLKDLYAMFGDWNLAFAAYNCGIGCVRSALRKSKKDNPDFWEIQQYLPRETRNYVPNFLACAVVAMDPEKYGFSADEMNFHKEYKYDVYVLKEPLNLESIAKAAEVPLEEIKELNPELIRNCTPIDASTYYLKIPESTNELFSANIEKIPYSEKKPYVLHKIDKGESIRSIADRFNVSKEEILEMNKFESLNQTLKLDSQILLPLSQRSYDSILIATKPNVNITDLIANNGGHSSEIKPVEEIKEITHTVKEGENLYIISQKYGVNLAELKRINNLDEDGLIKIGQKLIISDPNVKFIEQITSKTHKVQRGESFTTIADKYNITVPELKEFNKISSRTKKIRRGKTLKIPMKEIVAIGANGETINAPKLTEKIENSIAKTESEENPDRLILHKVKNGENLEQIAADYECSIDDIKKWNPNLVDGSKIYVNTKLKIYSDKTDKQIAVKKDKNRHKTYVVRSGDTLSSISRKFGVSISQLKKLNKIKDENTITIGKVLKIY
ncbi:MAG: hypothetical protein A2X64_01495 [Ignavibacteria bacterium GWF2_33_9]|nr:MAG: hypothetical protein A2X64_01495 [Ignavibacteria bacterium GWF2_33_9]